MRPQGFSSFGFGDQEQIFKAKTWRFPKSDQVLFFFLPKPNLSMSTVFTLVTGITPLAPGVWLSWRNDRRETQNNNKGPLWFHVCFFLFFMLRDAVKPKCPSEANKVEREWKETQNDYKERLNIHTVTQNSHEMSQRVLKRRKTTTKWCEAATRRHEATAEWLPWCLWGDGVCDRSIVSQLCQTMSVVLDH